MTGFLSGDNPIVEQLKMPSLNDQLGMLEEANFKLFQSLGRNGYHPITGEPMFEDSEVGNDVQLMANAAIKVREMINQINKAYAQELDDMALLLESSDIEVVTGVQRLKAMSKLTKERIDEQEKIITAQTNDVEREAKRKAGSRKGIVYLLGLYKERLIDYSKNNPDQLNKNTHKTGVFTHVKRNLVEQLEKDNYLTYFGNASEQVTGPPSMDTHKRRFREALMECGFPIKRTP